MHAQYEQELNVLRQQLAETQQMLQEAQARLLSHEVGADDPLSSADTRWQLNPRYSDLEDEEEDFLQQRKHAAPPGGAAPGARQEAEVKDMLHRWVTWGMINTRV